MTDDLNQDFQALKEWQASAWRRIADPFITAYERREMRNYMKDADVALRTCLRKISERERLRRSKSATRDAGLVPRRRHHTSMTSETEDFVIAGGTEIVGAAGRS